MQHHRNCGISPFHKRIFAIVLFALAATGCSQPGDVGTKSVAFDARIVAADSEPQNWLSHGRTYSEQRFSPLDDIAAGNVGGLGLAWYHDLDTFRGQEGTPLVVDGVMYATTAWSKIVALNAATGERIWQFDPEVPGSAGLHACCDVVNRGAAYADGRLFFGTIDGRLIAVDAKTGTKVWSVQTTDPETSQAISGAPRVAKGKVFIGNGGADQGVRGYISAYDQSTGKLAWRFYTVPGEPGKKDGAASDEVLERLARKTWSGDRYWQIGGGGTVWDSIVYDPDFDRLYVGVGNGGPWDRGIRSNGEGDNLFIGSILALDPDTGEYIWHYQETPGDQWDFTSTQQMILADLTIDGTARQVIMHAPKNGFFYVIDRKTGKPVSAETFVPVNWAEKVDLATGRPVVYPAARYDKAGPFLASSGGWGAHNWHPMAFSPQTGLVYIPAMQVPMRYATDGSFEYRPGLLNLGVGTGGKLPEEAAAIKAMLGAFQGRLIAWDPVAQKEVWRAERDSPWNGGVLATAGGLVFEGLADGTFRAHDAKTGKELWRFEAQQAIMPGPVSYAVNGVQYVAVMVGKGGAYNLAMPGFSRPDPRIPGRIMAFKLGGTAKLPVKAKADVPPFQPSDEKFTAAQIAHGDALFNSTCGACHGAGAQSIGVLPDLRRSGALANGDVWRQIVIDGMLSDNGMASFAKYLSPADAEDIRAYVNDRARVAKGAEKP
ncbi:PQQ-dependent dehydrogenase, methanol/ethanol family [Croceicoccus ponticola]|uniref:PQQ-dependent dehydrogenase, methanol/ethanol family n=1 Tax=Croceicoccus ponticola TaxID=2217664 RepID=A0A437H246_9SPHN|nr:PQQ-dependent dehydrogenase, methanol/ethanol family [Croceicoccus ponticola]